MSNTTYEEIRERADDAWRKIDKNPKRIGELCDSDVMSLAAQASTALPILEAALVQLCGGRVDKANAAIEHVMSFSEGKFLKTVRLAHINRIAGRGVSEHQLAAMVVDFKSGVGAVMMELERRDARKVGRMN